jgi:hypothetical protein
MSSKLRLIPVAVGLVICCAAAFTALQTAQAQSSVPVQTAVYRPAADGAVHVEPVRWYGYGYGYRSAYYRPYWYGARYYSYYRPYYRPYPSYYGPYPRVYSYYPGYYPPVYSYYPRSYGVYSYPAYGSFYW